MTRIWQGTVSVTNGSKIVTVTAGAPLSAANCPNDATVTLARLTYHVAHRIDTLSFELTDEYDGASGSVAAEIDPLNPAALSLVGVARSISEYDAKLQLLEARGFGLFYEALGATGTADPGPGKLAYVGASWEAATVLCIDVIDAAGVNQAAIIDQWGLGDIVVISSIETDGYRAYELTEPPSNEGPNAWRKLVEFAYVGGDGVLVPADPLRIVCLRAGTQGPGYQFDAEADDIAGRAAYDAQVEGFKVFVHDAGTGRAAVFRRQGAAGNWALVAYYTGPIGPQGDKGWAPQLVLEADGARNLFKLAGYVGGAGSAPTADVGKYLKADGTFTTIKADALDVRGATGAAGLDGASQFVRVDFVATANVNLASGLANGAAAIDGVVPATGKAALLTAQTAPAENGLYVCPAAGAASRHPSFATYDSMPGIGLRVMEGSSKGDTLWFCNSNKGGTLGSTALVFAEYVAGVRFDATQSLTLAQQGRARANIGADLLGGFRNKMINGDFEFWQRATSQTSSGYGSVDRWLNAHVGSSKTVSQQSFALGQVDVPGYPKCFCRTVVTSVAGASNFVVLYQATEGVRALAGKDVTLTFWAKADAPKNMAIELVQDFGTGGSPSSAVTGIGAQKVALTTSWQKFSRKITVPSVSGKTLGTAGNDKLSVSFWFDAGSTYSARTDSLGQQSGTFDIAHVSLVEGDATAEDDPFSPRHIQQELALCQRYYEVLDVAFSTSAYPTVMNVAYWKVEKRVSPALASQPAAGTGGTFSSGLGVLGTTSAYQSLANSSNSGGQLRGDAEL